MSNTYLITSKEFQLLSNKLKVPINNDHLHRFTQSQEVIKPIDCVAFSFEVCEEIENNNKELSKLIVQNKELLEEIEYLKDFLKEDGIL